MKKWFKFFGTAFFSHKEAKGATKRGYTNVFFGFLLVLVFLFTALVGSDMLPFGVHYASSPDLMATAHALLADADNRIVTEILDGDLRMKKQGGEYTAALLVNTLENAADKQSYSVNGFDVVVDTRPAKALAEVEAYCLSNDGNNTEISYEDYLTLSEVARLNFDFKLRYTGRELVLTEESVTGYLEYLTSHSEESRAKVEGLKNDLSGEKISKDEYHRAVYELYFEAYYPEITAYESSSKVPLLRNYYYHQYISKNIDNYLFIFDDYMTGSFETVSGNEVSFYGFFGNMENGALIPDGCSEQEANKAVDDFINDAFWANWFLKAYAHLINTISLAPFIALMLMVAALLSYSLLRLMGVESISSLGAGLKIVGSFSWFSGLSAAVIALALSFFVDRNWITALPLVLFFVALITRSVVFVITEKQLFVKQSEQKALQSEV